MTKINDLWTDLYKRGSERQSDRIEDLFALDTERLSRLTLKASGLFVDLSKNLFKSGRSESTTSLIRSDEMPRKNLSNVCWREN